MSPRHLLLRILRRWHARIGIVSMLFFLVLALTGLMLNHGSGMGLDARFIHAAWLARWYGMKTDAPRQAFRTAHHELIAANGRWLIDKRTVGEQSPQPIGLAELPGMYAIASDAMLYVYRDDGQLIDRLERNALPGTPVQALGSGEGKFLLRTASGSYSSADALTWQHTRMERAEWSVPVVLSASEQQTYERVLIPGISAQQLLLDLHSGRFAGRYGPLFVDLLAVMLVAMSATGAWLFLRPRRRRERH
jgi:hypothetical protein